MKLQAFRVVFTLGVAFLVACGGADTASDASHTDARIPAEVSDSTTSGGQSTLPDDDEVTALNRGCPRDPYACVRHCQSSGQKGKCTGDQKKACTCSAR